MATPFEILKQKLREAGCSVRYANTTLESGRAATLKLMVIGDESGTTRQVIVRDMGDEGYQLFTEVLNAGIDGDVQAILSALIPLPPAEASAALSAQRGSPRHA